MNCLNCGAKMEPGFKRCLYCGYRPKKTSFRNIVTTIFLLVFFFGLWFPVMSTWESFSDNHYLHPLKSNSLEYKMAFIPPEYNENMLLASSEELSNLVYSAQSKVYMFFTMYRQGTGFLIDEKGHVLTNTHIVQGDLVPIVQIIEGDDFQGKLVGYNDEKYVAVIYVKGLTD